MAGEGWHVSVDEDHQTAGTAVAVGTASWFFVTWRARILDVSRGDVESRLAMVIDVLERTDRVGGLPGVRTLPAQGVSFEFWFVAASHRDAFSAARVALREAFHAAGVGDPAPAPSSSGVDVMLMLEELPTLHRGDS